jgi:hypothetical protein
MHDVGQKILDFCKPREIAQDIQRLTCTNADRLWMHFNAHDDGAG